MPVQEGDLTTRARIREAALELFARNGVAGTSLRSVAARAGVSPSLIVHHFETKAGLRRAVDDAVLNAFVTALAAVDTTGTPEEVTARLNRAMSGIIGGDNAVRQYVGQSLVDASPASQRLFDELSDLVKGGLEELERTGVVRRGTDPVWRAYAVLFIILGPILLGRQLEARLGTDPFDPAVVSARSTSNIDILRHGLFS